MRRSSYAAEVGCCITDGMLATSNQMLQNLWNNFGLFLQSYLMHLQSFTERLRWKRQSAGSTKARLVCVQELYGAAPIALAPFLGNPLLLASFGINRRAPIPVQVGV